MNLQKNNPIDVSILKTIYNTYSKNQNIESLEVIKLKPHTKPLPNSTVSVASFPDKEEIIITVGEKVIKLRDNLELLEVVTALNILCFQDLTGEEEFVLKNEISKNFQYVDVVEKYNLYNHLLDHNIDVSKLDMDSQQEFLAKESDYTDNLNNKIEQLTFNTKQMFSKEIIPSPKQEFITGKKPFKPLVPSTKNSVFDKIANQTTIALVNELSNVITKLHDEAAVLSALYDSVDSLTYANVVNNLTSINKSYIASNNINLSSVSTIVNLSMSSNENQLLQVDSDLIKTVIDYINHNINVTVEAICKIDSSYKPNSVIMTGYKAANFTSDDLINWAKDPNKGPKYCEEQLARLPEEVKDRMIKEVESKI